LPVKSFSGPSPAGLMTIFYCLRFEIPQTWRARSPYLYPRGTGWPGYTPGHWVHFLSPMTLRDEVEVLEPPSNLASLICGFRLHIFLFLIFFLWSEFTWYCGHYWPIVPVPDDWWWWVWSSRWNKNWQGKPKYSEKTCPSATLSTTSLIRPDSGSNPGRHGGRPATNRLSHSTAVPPIGYCRYMDLRGVNCCTVSAYRPMS
jgi:hypothetical protein